MCWTESLENAIADECAHGSGLGTGAYYSRTVDQVNVQLTVKFSTALDRVHEHVGSSVSMPSKNGVSIHSTIIDVLNDVH